MLNNFLKTIEKITPKKYRWVLNHEGFKRYFANTGWMFFGQMFSLAVSFFIGAWLARYLGPENYGVLSYAVAFTGMFAFVASLGMDSILTRELVKYPEKRDELLGTAFWLKLIGGGMAIVLCVISAFIFVVNPISKLLIIIYSFTFILQTVSVINIYFQAEVKSKNNVKSIMVATLLSSILKVGVILLGKGVIWIVVIFVIDIFLQGVGFIVAYKKFGLKIKKWHFDKKLSKNILKNSWPLMLAVAANSIYTKIDQVIIGFLMDNYNVGIYAAAVKLVEIWYFVPGVICISLFPAIINAKKTSEELYLRRLKNLYILMISISSLMAVLITLLAKPIILVLFGSGYLESVNILRIYIWSSVGLFLGTAVTQYMVSENLVKTIFWLNFLAMVVNITLNIIFIPLLGLSGAAWATFISYMTLPAGVLIIKKK